MKGRIYKIGRKTKQASKITVYEGFGQCKVCKCALDNKEAEAGVCKPCQEAK